MHNILTGRNPTFGHRFCATASVMLLIALFVLVAPLATTPMGVSAPFLPIFSTAVVITEAMTSVLMYVRYRIIHSLFDATLAAAYAFSSLTAAVQLLVFPGVFSPTGLLGAGPQTAVWIWVFWHGGFPLFVLVGVVLRSIQGEERKRPNRIGGALLIAALAAAVALCFLATRHADLLPSLIAGHSYRALQRNPVTLGVMAVCLAALGAHLGTSRLRRLLDLWVAVALFAFLIDVSLTLESAARFTLGWYAARVASIAASTSVLVVLLVEICVLYTRLSRDNEALADRANRDGLTGLYNRRWFDTQYAQELRTAWSYGSPLSILMIDVDHFKQYNDTYGHLVGDECLITVANALRGALRRHVDVLCRYGGEEFVVLLPGCPARAAAAVAEGMRQAVAEARIAAPGGVAHVSVSIGTASVNSNTASSGDDPLARADANLYRAKAAGRNRVEAEAMLTAEA